MPTFVLLTKLSPEAAHDPQAYEELNRAVTERIKQHCPEVRWIGNYWILGPYDYLDIYEAPNEEVASQVATIIRTFGHATTETWTAVPWDRFLELMTRI